MVSKEYKAGLDLYDKIEKHLKEDFKVRGENNECVISLTKVEALQLFTYMAPEIKGREVKRVAISLDNINIYYGREEDE